MATSLTQNCFPETFYMFYINQQIINKIISDSLPLSQAFPIFRNISRMKRRLFWRWTRRRTQSKQAWVVTNVKQRFSSQTTQPPRPLIILALCTYYNHIGFKLCRFSYGFILFFNVVFWSHTLFTTLMLHYICFIDNNISKLS